eukprot:scaffold1220_cov259-Pinguiococcus_pyrenoidosus.AAC.49
MRRKVSQLPVHTAIPSGATPRQETRFSWPARRMKESSVSSYVFTVSQALHMKSSCPANSSLPELEKATDVIPCTKRSLSKQFTSP